MYFLYLIFFLFSFFFNILFSFVLQQQQQTLGNNSNNIFIFIYFLNFVLCRLVSLLVISFCNLEAVPKLNCNHFIGMESQHWSCTFFSFVFQLCFSSSNNINNNSYTAPATCYNKLQHVAYSSLKKICFMQHACYYLH